LTEHGQRLLGYAQRMLAIHDEAISSLEITIWKVWCA
jgi:DNA-binding transcriptional LysR family regulator